MKINNVLLAIMLMSSISCNAHNHLADKVIETAIKVVAASALYTAYHVYKADGNWNKAQRLMRKTNDQAITVALHIIKKISLRLEQCKSTALQKVADAIAEGIEEAKFPNKSIPQRISIVYDNNNTTVYVRT